MVKAVKTLLCIILCASAAAMTAGCSDDPDKSVVETSNVAQTTQAATTQQAVATADTPTQPATYNYVKIKEKSEDLTNRFDSYIDNYRFKGAAYFRIGNDFEYIGTNGSANIESHIDNSVNTCYYIGSVTKQFTAAAIMMLAEQEKLSVDDTLDKYYSSYEYGEDITIKNLLTMTSGIKSYMCVDGEVDTYVYNESQLGYTVSDKNSAEKNKKAIMDWIFSQDLLFEPDSQNKFSDSNYYILGDIIEQVSGMSYEEFITENIFKPLGMNSSSFEESDKLAAAYQGTDAVDWIYYDGVAYSSTGIISSVSDLLKWIYALNEGEVVSQDSLDEMFTAYKENYGYGFFVYGNKLAHMGNSGNYSAMLAFTRDEDEIYISLSNYKNSDPVFIYALFKNAVNPYYG